MDSDRIKDARIVRGLYCDAANGQYRKEDGAKFDSALDRLCAPAPVDGDARKLADAIERHVYEIVPDWATSPDDVESGINKQAVAALISSALRQARRETVERCADRAVAWQKNLCAQDNWSCSTCTECDQLRAAIKEAE